MGRGRGRRRIRTGRRITKRKKWVQTARAAPIGGRKSQGGKGKMRTKFHYGEVYDIHPTYGIDIPKGKIQIMGILNYQILPDWMDIQSWETGDAEFDWELMDRPWYQIFHCDSDNDDGEIILPEFALDEVFHKARKIKIEKWRNARHME
jgi:hypothetical protein